MGVGVEGFGWRRLNGYFIGVGVRVTQGEDRAEVGHPSVDNRDL